MGTTQIHAIYGQRHGTFPCYQRLPCLLSFLGERIFQEIGKKIMSIIVGFLVGSIQLFLLRTGSKEDKAVTLIVQEIRTDMTVHRACHIHRDLEEKEY